MVAVNCALALKYSTLSPLKSVEEAAAASATPGPVTMGVLGSSSIRVTRTEPEEIKLPLVSVNCELPPASVTLNVMSSAELLIVLLANCTVIDCSVTSVPKVTLPLGIEPLAKRVPSKEAEPASW